MTKRNHPKLFTLLFVISVILSGCGSNPPKNESSINEQTSSSLEETEKLISSEETESLSYQGRIFNYKFLEKDSLFQLTLDSYDSNNYIYVNLNNEIIENPSLTSDYLKAENFTDDSHTVRLNIYDLEGNDVTFRFINDSNHEEIMGIETIGNGLDIIAVKEIQETPTDSFCAIKFFDEKGNELCQTDSTVENDYLNSGYTPFSQLKDIKYIDWIGDSILQFSDRNKSTVFSMNIETGELLPPNAIFSDGYAIARKDNKCIIDTHGNVITDLSDSNRFESTFPISNDLFFAPLEKCFYNKYLQNCIDLTQYASFSYSRDELSDEASKTTTPNPFVFKDGYCQLVVYNDEGTIFYGIIDSDGNEIYPFTEKKFYYDGVISDGMLCLNGCDVYDIKSQSLIYGPSDIQSPLFYDGKAYYINQSNCFCTYDYKTQQLTQF